MKKWMVLIFSVFVFNNMLAMSRAIQGLKGASKKIPSGIVRQAPRRTFMDKNIKEEAKKIGKTTANKIAEGVVGGVVAGSAYAGCNWIAGKKDELIAQLNVLSDLAKDTYYKFKKMADILQKEPTAMKELEQEEPLFSEPIISEKIAPLPAQMNDFEKALFEGLTPDYDKALVLLRQGANPNSSGTLLGDLPLGRAIKQNNKELIEFLLNNGASLYSTINDEIGSDGLSLVGGSIAPLSLAIVNNSPADILELLINKTPDLTYSGVYGASPLLLAIENNNLKALNLLLEKDPVKVLKNNPRSPLYVAAEKNNIKAFKLLVNAGARVHNIHQLLNVVQNVSDSAKKEMRSYYSAISAKDLDEVD